MTNCLVITGGSRGIGEKAIALFQQHDWKIINISRADCKLPSVKNFNIDLGDKHWIETHATALINEVRDADTICLVHNAASYQKDTVTSLTAEALRQVLEVNLIATVALNNILIPHMKAGSSILYIGSTLSDIAVPNRASYVMSKHALAGLMKATCQDLAGKHITTCCICPGFVNTPMLTGNIDRIILDGLIKQRVTAERLIEPNEIADLIYFCATHPVINGAVLHANLGQVMS